MKHHEPDFDGEGLLNEQQAASLLGFTPKALQNWRLTGAGPRYIRISARAIRYHRNHLREWTESRVQTSTADTPRSKN